MSGNILNFPHMAEAIPLLRRYIDAERSCYGRTRCSPGRMDFDLLFCRDLEKNGDPESEEAVVQKVTLIKQIVSEEYLVPVRDLEGPSRRPVYVRPRQVAMFLAWKLTQQPLTLVGRLFGGRDSTTVHHAIHAIKTLQEADPHLRAHILACIARYTAHAVGIAQAQRSDNLRLATLRPAHLPPFDDDRPDPGGEAA